MDNQPIDPNNPVPATPQPVNPVPIAEPPVPAPAASMWGGQPDLPATPPSVPSVPAMNPVPTFVPPTSPPPATAGPEPMTPTTPNFGENPMPMPSAVPISEPVAPSAFAGVPDVPSVPSWASAGDNSANITPPPPEAMPTDLSNLMGSAPVTPSEVAQPTVVVTPTGPETNQVVTSGRKGFPKIVLILGAILILVALGASAYFILGIGNSSTLPTSLPAEQQTLTTPPKIVVPSVAPAETGTGSATLGNPSGATISSTPAPATTSGTSALELLRSRITPTPVR